TIHAGPALRLADDLACRVQVALQGAPHLLGAGVVPDLTRAPVPVRETPVEVAQVAGTLGSRQPDRVTHPGQHPVHLEPGRGHRLARLVDEHALDLVDPFLATFE